MYKKCKFFFKRFLRKHRYRIKVAKTIICDNFDGYATKNCFFKKSTTVIP